MLIKCGMSITVGSSLKPLKKKKTHIEEENPSTLYIISDELQTIVILCELKPYKLLCVFVCVHMIMITHSSVQRQISVRMCKWSGGCRHPCSVLIQRLDANISTIHLQTCSQDCFQQLSPHCGGSEHNLHHTHTFLRSCKHLHKVKIMHLNVCLRWNCLKRISNICTIVGTKSLFITV